MHDDINDILALEIKKEMADRYFGFRKLIEDDMKEFDEQVLESFLRMERKIGFDLVRLYILLKDEKLIHEFFQLAGMDRLLFYDPYLTESPTLRKKVLSGLRTRGITRFGRFRNLVFDIYVNLVEEIESYRSKLLELADEQQNIADEIHLFYRNNDLGTMMNFLRKLNDPAADHSGSMQGGLLSRAGEELENKLKVQPPPPVSDILPVIPPVNKLSAIKGACKKIVRRAFKQQGKPEIKELAQP